MHPPLEQSAIDFAENHNAFALPTMNIRDALLSVERSVLSHRFLSAS